MIKWGGTVKLAPAPPKIPFTQRGWFDCVADSQLPNTMANTKSAIKAARKAVRLTLRNKAAKTRLKTLHKAFDAAVKKGDAAVSKAAGQAYLSAMDRAVKSGVVHRNAASRAKSHASKYVLAK
jgi:small subunit ribosomal protein S20